MAYAITICTTAEEFSDISKSWDNLLDRSQYSIPHWRHAWVSSWLKSYWKDKPLCFILVWVRNSLVAAAPLVLDAMSFYGTKLTTLRFASSAITTANFFIVDMQHLGCTEPLSNHIASLKNSWTIGELTDIPKWIADNLCEHLSESNLPLRTLRRRARNSPYLPLNGSHQIYLESQSSNFRYDVGRCSRKIQNAGSVIVERFDDQRSVSGNLDIAFEVSRKSWKGPLRTDMAGTDESRLFYQSLCQSTDIECRPMLWVLSLDDRPIAIQFYIADQSTIHLVRSDFRENYSRLRPGAYLQNEIIRECYSMNFKELDFGGMDYSYKMRYTNHVRLHDHIDLFHSGPSSRLLHFLKRTKRLAQFR